MKQPLKRAQLVQFSVKLSSDGKSAVISCRNLISGEFDTIIWCPAMQSVTHVTANESESESQVAVEVAEND